MKKLSLFYILFAFMLFFTPIFAVEKYNPQVDDPVQEKWRWRHFSELDGKGVTFMVEDHNSNMWFGVSNGVIKYDGLKWETYKFDADRLGAECNYIFVTSAGRIFAASTGGIRVYEENKWRPFFPKDRYFDNRINKMIELGDGSILCATMRGLIHFKDGNIKKVYTDKKESKQFEPYVSKKDIIIIDENIWPQIEKKAEKSLSIPKTNIEDILVDEKNRLWLAVGYEGVLSGKMVTATFAENGTLQNFIVRYTEDKDAKFYQSVYLLKMSDGSILKVSSFIKPLITKFQNGKAIQVNFPKKFGEIGFSSAIRTSDNNIFIGDLGRFFLFKNNVWKEYKSPDIPIPSSTRIFLHEDSKGDIWIAGKRNEVFLLEYTSRNWATYNNLNFQDQAKNGDYWFIDIDGKVVKKSEDGWVSYSTRDGLISHPVRVIITKQGQIWAAGSHHGIAASALYENEKWHKKLYPELSWNIDERSLYEDFSGSLYLGANIDFMSKKGQKGGIIKYPDPIKKKDYYEHYYRENSNVSSYGIAEAKDGHIWIAGTRTWLLEGNKLNTAPKIEGIKIRRRIDCINVGRDTIMWLGSRNYGLFRFDGNKWISYNMENGLVNNSITSINAINDSSVWISTSKDISHFDGRSWSNYVFPEELNIVREGGEIRSDNDNNIWINQSSRQWYRRALETDKNLKNKNFKFRTIFYHPDTLSPETKIKYYEKEVSSIGNTLVKWSGVDPYNTTPLDFLQYSYKLDDGEWSDFSLETSRFFVQLPSGNHILQIRSRDSAFNIDPTPVKIEFTVLYPFYLRPSFLVPIFILIAISIVLLIRVRKRGRIIKQARKETEEILKNIKQGLFLIDKDFRLGLQYSAFLKDIFKEDDPANKKFIDLIRGKVSEKDLESIESYLEIMFRPDLAQSVLDDLNPFDEIKFSYPDGSEERYFSFRFRKIIDDGESEEINSLMVVVQDITEQVVLAKKLESSKEDSTRRMNWILDILHVEPGLLQEFLNSSSNEIVESLNLLDDIEVNVNHKAHLETIFRSMHLIKGNAGLLEINSFADDVHRIEDIITEIQQKESLSNDDIARLRAEIEKISQSLQDVNNLLDRLSAIYKQMHSKKGGDNAQLTESLKNLVKNVSKSEQKKVELVADRFKLSDFPYKVQLIVRETLAQLVKNSIIHGIESPIERKEHGKEETGVIEIQSSKKEKEYGFSIKDDGRGLQIEKLKEKLAEAGAVTAEELASWPTEKIAESIFMTKISTADNVNINAGRGIGLGAVKKKVEGHGGKITLDFKANEYCKFTVVFKESA